ncbi:MAG: PfkB family carbohydrate kinase [Planctomycetota bacterium]|nr:PfkB family carbohydrate kinase [Planctomycetota bacterium]
MRCPNFTSLKVAVVGDLIADHWLFAQPTRLSREAPVMVLKHISDSIGAGGAGNVARNLRALGAHVTLLGAVGRDANGRELLRLLEGEGIDTVDVAVLAAHATPTKTRVLAAEARRNPHQILRIDREPNAPIDANVRETLADRVRALTADVVIVSDYGYGLVADEIAAACKELAAAGTLVVLDPRTDVDRFTGIAAITPNVGELARFTQRDETKLDHVRELRLAAREMMERARPRWLLVTRGNLGMALFGEGLPEEGVAVEASGSGEVTDVCGAGDTAAAVFALALAAGVEPSQAMVLANAAAGIVVMEKGAATCRPQELAAALVGAPSVVRLSRPNFA